MADKAWRPTGLTNRINPGKTRGGGDSNQELQGPKSSATESAKYASRLSEAQTGVMLQLGEEIMQVKEQVSALKLITRASGFVKQEIRKFICIEEYQNFQHKILDVQMYTRQNVSLFTRLSASSPNWMLVHAQILELLALYPAQNSVGASIQVSRLTEEVEKERNEKADTQKRLDALSQDSGSKEEQLLATVESLQMRLVGANTFYTRICSWQEFNIKSCKKFARHWTGSGLRFHPL